MTGGRIELRVPEGMKVAFTDAAYAMGYSSLTAAMVDTYIQAIFASKIQISHMNKKILLAKDNEDNIKKIRYLQRRLRSEAFAAQRFIKILRSYEAQEQFIDQDYVVQEFDLFVQYARYSENPIRLLKSVMKEIINKKWHWGEKAVKAELIRLGVKQKDLEKINWTKSSIGYQRRHHKREEKNGSTKRSKT
ncbi:hypothetical protein GF327_09595 [Candidatus Woesearchaeota archaeon]|nr:hypothetical protein [Candidatus Woesearchaeota archaeon]